MSDIINAVYEYKKIKTIIISNALIFNITLIYFIYHFQKDPEFYTSLSGKIILLIFIVINLFLITIFLVSSQKVIISENYLSITKPLRKNIIYFNEIKIIGYKRNNIILSTDKDDFKIDSSIDNSNELYSILKEKTQIFENSSYPFKLKQNNTFIFVFLSITIIIMAALPTYIIFFDKQTIAMYKFLIGCVSPPVVIVIVSLIIARQTPKTYYFYTDKIFIQFALGREKIIYYSALVCYKLTFDQISQVLIIKYKKGNSKFSRQLKISQMFVDHQLADVIDILENQYKLQKF